MIDNSIYLEYGTCINKIERVALNFCKTFDKTALYFTKPLGLKEGFDKVHLDNEHHGTIFMGCFISTLESEFLDKYGFEKFEDLLAEAEVDPTDIKRSSIVH